MKICPNLEEIRRAFVRAQTVTKTIRDIKKKDKHYSENNKY